MCETGKQGKEKFKLLTKPQQKKLSLNEFAEYKKKERAYNFYKGNSIQNSLKNDIWHYVLLCVLKVLRFSKKQKLYVIADHCDHRKKPVIYACTHVSYDDIVMTFEAIKNPCWLFLGNPALQYRTLNGWMLEKNGVIYIDTYDKEDRIIAKENAINLIKEGGSLLIYPEGAWNLTDNLPVMKLYNGAVDMALRAGADLVPIAIEQYGDNFYVNIGENISFHDKTESVTELTKELRDLMATLKWEIWEKMDILPRKSVPNDLHEHFAEDILATAGDNGYTMQMVEDERYHDKDTADYQTVFSFMEKLTPCKENAFLFRTNEYMKTIGRGLLKC
ncbi:MAG: lysophospholipid acyltransferase family protein [Lachnospiraceae bacterium]